MQLISLGGKHHHCDAGMIAPVWRAPLYMSGWEYALARVLLLWGAGMVAGESEETTTEASDADAESAQQSGNSNASKAKAVETWIPMSLGLVLLVVMLGWCGLNVYRASKADREAEEETSRAKSEPKYRFGMVDINHANSRHSGTNGNSSAGGVHHLGGVDSTYGSARPRSQTGDISPDDLEKDSRGPIPRVSSNLYSSGTSIQRSGSNLYHSGTASLQRSGSRLRHGSMRSVNFLESGRHTESGRFGIEEFEGGELQGKKAPGERGETYKNPLSKNLDAPVPIKANLGHTKTAVITAGSAPDRGVAPGACSDKLWSTGSEGERDTSSPQHLRPHIAQARRASLVVSRDNSTSRNTYNSGNTVAAS